MMYELRYVRDRVDAQHHEMDERPTEANARLKSQEGRKEDDSITDTSGEMQRLSKGPVRMQIERVSGTFRLFCRRRRTV